MHPKIDKDVHLGLSVSIWVSPWTPGSPKWCPMYQKWSLKVSKITDFNILSQRDPNQRKGIHAHTNIHRCTLRLHS